MALLVVGMVDMLVTGIGKSSLAMLLVGVVLGTGLAYLLALIRETIRSEEISPWNRRSPFAQVSVAPAPPQAAARVAAPPAVSKGPAGAPAWLTGAKAFAKSFAAFFLVVATTMVFRTVVALELLQ
jgi:hypothetical protein